MSNTTLRILSSIVLVSIVVGAAIISPHGILALLLVSGLFLVDELIYSMFAKARTHFSYLVAMTSFLAGFILINYLDQSPVYYDSKVFYWKTRSLFFFFNYFIFMNDRIIIFD